MAEREGFEPSVPCGTRALQARAISQTTRPLQNIKRRKLYHDWFSLPGLEYLYNRANVQLINLAVFGKMRRATIHWDGNGGS